MPQIGILTYNLIKCFVFKLRTTIFFGSYYLKTKAQQIPARASIHYIWQHCKNKVIYTTSLFTGKHICTNIWANSISFTNIIPFPLHVRKKKSFQMKTLWLKSSQQPSRFVDLTVCVAVIQTICQKMVFTSQ